MIGLIIGLAAASAGAAPPTDALGAADLGAVAAAVRAIEGSDHTDPDELFAAARACEDKLLDPGHAATIYRRIVADHPSARVATAAARRLADLRELIGERGEAAGQAAALAQLIAHADDAQATDVYQRAAQLTEAPWPGAPAAGRWLADWLRRNDRPLEAVAHYLRVVDRWPASPDARLARRGAVGAALDAHAWTLADTLIAALPAIEAADRAIRDDLHRHAARGRARDRGYVAAWLVIAAALAAFLAELGFALHRTPPGQRRRALRPPVEIIYLAPVAAVLIGVAITANRLIAPAVATISLGGLTLAWLSGAALDQRRRLHRHHRARSLVHILLCLLSVAALLYIALTRDALIDALIETVRFGPDA
ncbi:MAG TPA: hypothetical protein VGC42_21020 [Kofleriaceae bacterium]